MAPLLAPAVVGRTSCPIGWLARWRILWTPEVFQGRGFFKPGDNGVPRGLNRRIVLRVGISVDTVVWVSVTTIRLGLLLRLWIISHEPLPIFLMVQPLGVGEFLVEFGIVVTRRTAMRFPFLYFWHIT